MARTLLFMQLFYLLAHLLLVGRRGVFILEKKISDQIPHRKQIKEARVSGNRIHHGWKVQCQEFRVAGDPASMVQRKKETSAGFTLLSSSYPVWDSSLGDGATTVTVDLTPFGDSL